MLSFVFVQWRIFFAAISCHALLFCFVLYDECLLPFCIVRMTRTHSSSTGGRFAFVGATVFALVAVVFLQQTLAQQGGDLQAFVVGRRLILSSASSFSSAPCSSSKSNSSKSARVSVLTKKSSSLSSALSSRSLVPCGTSAHLSSAHSSSSVLPRPSRRLPGVIVPSGTLPTAPTSQTAIVAGCGDGLVIGSEECDDGNKTANDGCSASCIIETGFACGTAQPSVCVSTCGDGIIATNERCDDENGQNGDGCSSSCKIEFTYSCTGTPSVCTVPAYCGNSIVEDPETCDDGNSRSGDGCYKCALEEQ